MEKITVLMMATIILFVCNSCSQKELINQIYNKPIVEFGINPFMVMAKNPLLWADNKNQLFEQYKNIQTVKKIINNEEQEIISVDNSGTKSEYYQINNKLLRRYMEISNNQNAIKNDIKIGNNISEIKKKLKFELKKFDGIQFKLYYTMDDDVQIHFIVNDKEDLIKITVSIGD